MDIKIGGKFKLNKKLGEGAFGVAVSGFNVKTSEEVAIKLESLKCEQPMLHYESKIYEQMKSEAGFPNVHYYGVEGEYTALVMDILGPSLQDLFDFCDQNFTLKTQLWIAIELIKRAESLHSKNFIHRDIKPENFLVGHGKKESTIFMIDFGLAKRFRCPKTDVHLQHKQKGGVFGTARYASLNAHSQFEQSRKDDLEAIGFVLIYFAKNGYLPWMDAEQFSTAAQCKIKEETSIEELCQGLPECYTKYMNYVRGLEFEQTPDYQLCRSFFKDLFIQKKFEEDGVYDWHFQKKKILEGKKRAQEEKEEKERLDKIKKENKGKNKISKKQEQLAMQQAIIQKQEEEKQKKLLEKKKKMVKDMEEQKLKEQEDEQNKVQREKEERQKMIDKEIKNKMSQIELHCIPKTKRRLMGMLDEEEKKQDEQNYVIVPKKFESASQIMNTLNFINAIKK